MCSVCSHRGGIKRFQSRNAFDNHLRSRKHREAETEAADGGGNKLGSARNGELQHKVEATVDEVDETSTSENEEEGEGKVNLIF